MKEQKTINTRIEVKIPCGKFCGHNCTEGCIYWQPHDRDRDGRQYCSYYRKYYYPKERQGCFSFKR